MMKIVDLILELEVPVDCQNRRSQTPLDVAINSPYIKFRIVRHVVKLKLAGLPVSVELPTNPWVGLPPLLEHFNETEVKFLQELAMMETLQTSENTVLKDVLNQTDNQ